MNKRDIYKILFLISFWEFCAIFITFYDSSVLGFKSEIEGGQSNFWFSLSTVIVTCFIGASILGSLEVLFLSKVFRKKPLGISLVIKTSIYILFILFFSSFAIIYIYSSEIAQPMFSKDVYNLFLNKFLSVSFRIH